MGRAELLDKLDKVTDKAAALMQKEKFPAPVVRKYTTIGNLFVGKNSKGYYDILTPEKRPLYEDLSVFDVAVIIAQRYNDGDRSAITKIISLETKYSKHHTDMIHYLHCFKGAKRHRDLERMAILEDKFQIAEQNAKDTRDSISFFKKAK
jgi:hypothetical protein